MKRLMALFLALMLILSFAACDEKPTSEAKGETKPTQGESKDEATFTETVVVDNEQCAIKITGINPDNMWGYTLEAQFENKSADKNYMFSVDSAAINGVESDPFFATEVAAGKKANEEISFQIDELKENNVGDVTDIELTFRVYDKDDWAADDVVMETVHIYPYGEDKAVQFVREAQESDNVIIDNEYVTAIVTGYEVDDFWGYTVNLYLVNKTDTNVMVTLEDVSVNGYMADPFYAEDIPPEKCSFTSIQWSETTFEENAITEVDEIEFLFRMYDDNWIDGDLVSETITLNP